MKRQQRGVVRRLYRLMVTEARPLTAVAAALGSGWVARGVRYEFLESRRVAALCESLESWACRVRSAAVVAAHSGAIGWLAAGSAAVAVALTVKRQPSGGRLAWFAWIVGSCGLVLYDATPSAVAVLVAGLILADMPERATDATYFRPTVGKPRRA